MKKKNILSIIGIRSKSSELKNKNIRLLGNKHLVGWILGAAKKSKYINRVIVSTDSVKYQRIAKSYKAEVPFLRPKKLSAKNSNEIDFIKHTLDFLKKKENYTPDIVVRLLATVPFQKTKDIDRLIELVLKKKFDSAAVVTKAKQHPKKAQLIEIVSSARLEFAGDDTQQPINITCESIPGDTRGACMLQGHGGVLILPDQRCPEVDIV